MKNLLEKPQAWVREAIRIWDAEVAAAGDVPTADPDKCEVTEDTVYLRKSDGTPLAKYVLTKGSTLIRWDWSGEPTFQEDLILTAAKIIHEMRAGLEVMEKIVAHLVKEVGKKEATT